MTVKERPDIVRFKNIDDEDFTWWYDKAHGGNAQTIKAGQEVQMTVHKAQVFADHLVTRVLQKKKIKFYKRNTPLRKKLLGEVLPDLPDFDPEAISMTPEEKEQAFKNQIAMEFVETKREMKEENDERDKKMEAMEKELKELKEANKPVPKVPTKTKPKS